MKPIDEDLRIGAIEGDVRLVRRALDHGARTSSGPRGTSPLMLACMSEKKGAMDVVRLLLEMRTQLAKKDYKGWSAISFACRAGNRDIANLLFDRGAEENVTAEQKTLLHLAAESGEASVLAMLLQRDSAARIMNRPDASGRTPLHSACRSGQLDPVKLLVSYKVKLHKKDTGGRQPLHVACELGKLRIAKVLLSGRADIDARDRQGFTPLMCACRAGHDGLACELLLLRADPEAKNEAAETARDIAVPLGLSGVVKGLVRLAVERDRLAREAAKKAAAAAGMGT